MTGDDEWIFGVKVRGAVREWSGCVYFNPDLGGKEGGWVWMTRVDDSMPRGLALSRAAAMAQVEAALGVDCTPPS